MFIVPLGAIDIGSNATRLQITNIEEYATDTVNKKVVWIRVPLRLGEDAFGGGKISREKRDHLAEAMQGFAHIMRALNVVDYKAYATSALREASNSREVIDHIFKKSGLCIEVIDGQVEADIIFESGMPTVAQATDKNYLFVDVGGGSTELTIVSQGKRTASKSFSTGTLRILSGKTDEGDMKKMKKWIDLNSDGHSPSVIVGSGGNINNVLRLLSKKEEQSIDYDELENLYGHISSLTIEERIHDMKLNPHRADVIVPAMGIFLYLMRSCNIDRVIVPNMGLTQGTVKALYAAYKEGGNAPEPDSRKEPESSESKGEKSKNARTKTAKRN